MRFNNMIFHSNCGALAFQPSVALFLWLIRIFLNYNEMYILFNNIYVINNTKLTVNEVCSCFTIFN